MLTEIGWYPTMFSFDSEPDDVYAGAHYWNGHFWISAPPDFVPPEPQTILAIWPKRFDAYHEAVSFAHERDERSQWFS